jgi:class 3 adenylate cyclase
MHRFLSPIYRRELQNGVLRPKKWEEITMVTMDIVGYTEHSSKMNLGAISSLLRTLYRDVDRLAAEYAVDKIDIVGDAYIAVSNCPNNAMAFSLACIALAEDTPWDAANPDLGCLKLRAAVHTGKVTGLVLDAAPFKYTLVGDTVITVKFLETSATPGSVTCSASTAQSLDAEQFIIRPQPDNPDIFNVLWAGDIADTVLISSNMQFMQISNQFLGMFDFTRKQLLSMRALFGPRTRVEAIQTAIEQCIQFTFPTSTAVVLYERSGSPMSVALGFVQDLTQPETCVVVTCRRLPDCKQATPVQTRAKSVPSMIVTPCEEEALAKLSLRGK